MSVRSGKFGLINGLTTLRSFVINDTIANVMFTASNTRQGRGRNSGNQDWNGNGALYGSQPPIMPGQYFDFLGYIAPTNGVLGANGQRATGTAIVDSVACNWNWQGGESLNATLNFSGHGALTWASGAAIADESAPDVPVVCGTKIEYSVNGSSWAELTDLLTATLTITSENKAYVNSSTDCWNERQPGNIDWTLAINQQSEDRSLLAAAGFDKGDNVQLRLYVNATDYYLLKWGKIGDFSNLSVNAETGDIIARTINVAMNGWLSGNVGEIALPDGSTFWPASASSP